MTDFKISSKLISILTQTPHSEVLSDIAGVVAYEKFTEQFEDALAIAEEKDPKEFQRLKGILDNIQKTESTNPVGCDGILWNGSEYILDKEGVRIFLRAFPFKYDESETSDATSLNPEKVFYWLDTADSSTHGRKLNFKTYLIHNKTTGLVKIGKAIDVQARIKELEYACGTGLAILIIIDKDIERQLHLKFQQHRVKGEWFKFSDSIKEYLFQAAAALDEGSE